MKGGQTQRRLTRRAILFLLLLQAVLWGPFLVSGARRLISESARPAAASPTRAPR